jgi:CBS domain-containing protein
MFKISDLRVEDLLLFKKPAPVKTIKPGSTLVEAAGQMQLFNVGLLVVTDDQGETIGVISERDIVRRAVVPGKPVTTTTVEAVMTPKPTFTFPAESVTDCLVKFKTYHCRHLPVSSPENPLLGIVSERDMMNFLLKKLHEEKFLILDDQSEEKLLVFDEIKVE